VADSDPAAEYAECLLKGRSAADRHRRALGGAGRAEGRAGRRRARAQAAPGRGVFTTLPVSDGAAHALTEHLERLSASARAVYGKDLPPQLPAEVARCLAGSGSGAAADHGPPASAVRCSAGPSSSR